MDNKEHWENIYHTKNPNQVSWTQDTPQTSLELIEATGCSKDAEIIDIGGGDSKLVDHLLARGYNNITVLDISSKALERAQKRLQKQAAQVNWVVSDVLDYAPRQKFDIWHDRAAFHFLTRPEQIKHYIKTVNTAVKGHFITGTFSHHGPKKCSGLDIEQYNSDELNALFGENFVQEQCLTDTHITPFDTSQEFQFCRFKRKA